MAKVKALIGEYEDALNIIEKALKNEAQMTSKHSTFYKTTLKFKEMTLAEARKKGAIAEKKKKSLMLKIIPNTPLKVAIYSGVIGAGVGLLYAFKRKSN
mmetsp:Transcript_20319/g.17984  ORF Transcript_20319/g.17984 Transcript_20319/m.17984 type:complete len:99 (+) Transcript_20319:400-696(+)